MHIFGYVQYNAKTHGYTAANFGNIYEIETALPTTAKNAIKNATE